MADYQKDVEKKGAPPTAPCRVSQSRLIGFYLLSASISFSVVYGMNILRARAEQHHLPTVTDVADPELIWNQVPPSPVDNLVWIPCYTDLLCAKMTVPLDYADPKGPSAVIAMAKSPARISRYSGKYRGPILFNPGGPGLSGVDSIIQNGAQMQALFGDEYDVVGFDPRGAGRTIPNVNVFPDDAEGARWQLQTQSLALPNSTENAVARIHAQWQVYGKLAESRTMDTSPYVSTALMCRDMLNMMKAHGWEKIQYWGYSYGTMLGSTFAAMFPDKIERLLLDGVGDTVDYYATVWSKMLVDTDKVLDLFFEECATAGPDRCALHESTGSKVRERFMKIVASIEAFPMAVTTDSLTSPTDYGVVDHSLVLQLLLAFLKAPYPIHAGTVTPTDLVSAFAAAEKGDPVPLWNLYKSNTVQFKCQCGPNQHPPAPMGADAQTAIACSDGDPVQDTIEELEKDWEKMSESSMFGPIWDMRARCSGWKIRPVERFTGPIVGNTSYPILLIGNAADPVTPLANAHKMSRSFNGSVVLTQNSAGHGIMAATSSCTARAVRAYFREGKLPEPGTVCQIESKMFPKDDLIYDSAEWLSDVPENEREAVKAWKELSETFAPARYGLGM